ncbi:MAG: dTDP-4-dehydrorhamnose reductase [Acidobacteria bacterium]|nr:dTDP-4-dehydrorhamnose reductase [Acidobacteriota bacterium]
MIVVTGVTGQLGTAFRRRLGDDARYLTRPDLDLTDPGAIRSVIEKLRPTVVINCAAYTAVDQAEEDEETARLTNATAVGELSDVTKDIGARLVTFSTDYVFDGSKEGPYVETDQPHPINAYGRTKLEGERLALAANRQTLVIRTSWVLSATHPTFASTMLRLIANGPVQVVDDQRGHPTFVDDLAAGSLDALDAETTGTIHLTNQGTTTWYGLAREIADLAGLDAGRVRPCTTDDFPRPAKRPANSVPESVRLVELGLAPLPDYHKSLDQAVAQLSSR